MNLQSWQRQPLKKGNLVKVFNGSAMDYIRTSEKLNEISGEGKTFSKKAFQKFVKQIRLELVSHERYDTPKMEYPKAMMTGVQMGSNTATINCGDKHFDPEYIVGVIVKHPDFLTLMETSGAVWNIETTTTWDGEKNPQIRISYLEGIE